MKETVDVLVHGYGLLDAEGRGLSVGARMSGLALYNTVLVDGLSLTRDLAFLTGRIGPVSGWAEQRQDAAGRRLYEYDASFPRLLESRGRFRPELADFWYRERVADDDNPVYRHLAQVYRWVLADCQPRVVNPHNLNAAAAWLWAAAALPSRPKVVVTVHDITPRQLAFVATGQKLIDGFVATSRYVAKALRQGGIRPERIRVIHNGLDLTRFQEAASGGGAAWTAIARRERLNESCPFQVLVPARRVPGKGIRHALEGFDRFRRRHRGPVRLLISGADMGDPDHERELLALTAYLDSAPDVHFLGPLGYTELPALFAASTVSLLPSTAREGFGYVNLEAMASGGPTVVATAQGGCLDYLEHEVNALLVPPGDPEAIAAALGRLAADPALARRLRQAAQVTARRFTARTMIAGYQDLLFKDTPVKPLTGQP